MLRLVTSTFAGAHGTFQPTFTKRSLKKTQKKTCITLIAKVTLTHAHMLHVWKSNPGSQTLEVVPNVG